MGSESERARGKLKIFFGYAAGVGKTYAMLSEARVMLAEGTEVVCGYIEAHDRPETTALIAGFEQLPALEIDYKGVRVREFDLDGALRRKPALMLVDELAHTNAKGCRHDKRYQDVEELLRAGIDVYTTVNVQHLESLNDVVQSITGVVVRERIPDSVFDGADQVELVDIDPEELAWRLSKGKIYKEAQAKRALENFFTHEKLVALREIALRRTADRVNHAAEKEARQKPYHTREHILVCVSPAPSGAKVIRAAARMTGAFHGVLTALYVETPDATLRSDADKTSLRDNLRLAEQLGAQIASVFGDDVPGQIAEYAQASRVSKIVMGRSSARRGLFTKTNYVDRLTSLQPNIDVYIIPDQQPSLGQRWHGRLSTPQWTLPDLCKTLGILLLATLFGLAFDALGLGEINTVMVYILGVLVTATVTGGHLYSAASSVLSVLLFDFLFIEPRYTLHANAPGYPMIFVIMLLSSIVTSSLTTRVKNQAQQAAQKAFRTEVLLETNRKLQMAGGQTEILRETGGQLVKLLDREVVFYPAAGNSLGDPVALEDGAEPETSADERAVAEWVYRNNKRAGASTNTLSAAEHLYLAVRGMDKVLAVVGIKLSKSAPLEPFEKSLTVAILGDCALALEKQQLQDSQARIAVQVEHEQLRANLLRAISHDLRTPLTSISGNADILIKSGTSLSEADKKELFTDIYEDSMWLINLVENLLSITRIDSGTLALNLKPELLEEVISEALQHINRNGARYRIQTSVENELLMAAMDSQLIMQVLINIVDNAIKYTPPGSQIAISARRAGAYVRVEVADDGPGIPEAAKDRLFDMFYTVGKAQGDGRRGLGLGLFLCKSIVTAHGGEIYARDNQPRGTVIGFTLKLAEVNVE